MKGNVSRSVFERRTSPMGERNSRFLLLRELAHKNIIEYLHGYIDSTLSVPQASMSTELADLGTLNDLLKSRQDSDWLKESAIWHLSMQLANAVEYLQYGIRDASSTNELESPD